MTNPTIPKAEIIEPIPAITKLRAGLLRIVMEGTDIGRSANKVVMTRAAQIADETLREYANAAWPPPTTTPAEAGDGELVEQMTKRAAFLRTGVVTQGAAQAMERGIERIKHLETALANHIGAAWAALNGTSQLHPLAEDALRTALCGYGREQMLAALAARIEPLDGDRA